MSRYGYNSLENMNEALNRTLEAKIPIDVQYGVIHIYFFKYIYAQINIIFRIFIILENN